jgi:hypothetical protein
MSDRKAALEAATPLSGRSFIAAGPRRAGGATSPAIPPVERRPKACGFRLTSTSDIGNLKRTNVGEVLSYNSALLNVLSGGVEMD